MAPPLFFQTCRSGSKIASGFRSAALSLPGPQPLGRLRHVRSRAREGESDRAVAAAAVEIDARRRGDTGLVQHAAAEIQAVIGQAGDIGIEVEGAVRRGEI